MLDVKTCQKLKAAGFPQEPKMDISGIDGEFFGGFYYPIRNEIGETAVNFYDQRQYDQWLQSEGQPFIELIKIPQVDELIAAFNGTIKLLTAPKMTCEGNEIGITCGWVITWFNEYLDKEKPQRIEVIGGTLEEALVKLWLVVFKK